MYDAVAESQTTLICCMPYDTMKKTNLRYSSRPGAKQGSYKKLHPIFKDFSRTTLDFQATPTRNVISQILEKKHIPSTFEQDFKA